MKQNIILLILVVSSYFSFAQKKYFPTRIENEIQFDGLLNETVWEQAQPVTDFMRYIPDSGAVTEKTSVRILYNNEYLYAGFTCSDKEPNKLIAQSMESDFTIGNDDEVALIIRHRLCPQADRESFYCALLI